MCPKIIVSIKNFNFELLITLLYSFLILLHSVDLLVLLDISFIRFGSLKVKLQSFLGDVSALKLCKLNTNYAIKLYECSRKKHLPNIHRKMFFDK